MSSQNQRIFDGFIFSIHIKLNLLNLSLILNDSLRGFLHILAFLHIFNISNFLLNELSLWALLECHIWLIQNLLFSIQASFTLDSLDYFRLMLEFELCCNCLSFHRSHDNFNWHFLPLLICEKLLNWWLFLFFNRGRFSTWIFVRRVINCFLFHRGIVNWFKVRIIYLFYRI